MPFCKKYWLPKEVCAEVHTGACGFMVERDWALFSAIAPWQQRCRCATGQEDENIQDEKKTIKDKKISVLFI